MVAVEVAVLVGLFVGVFGRSYLGYLKAKREAKLVDPNAEFKFDREYLTTALYSLFVSGAAALLLFPMVIDQAPLGGSLVAVLVFAFGAGWAGNDMVNMLVSVGQSTIRVSRERVVEVREFLAKKQQEEPPKPIEEEAPPIPKE